MCDGTVAGIVGTIAGALVGVGGTLAVFYLQQRATTKVQQALLIDAYIRDYQKDEFRQAADLVRDFREAAGGPMEAARAFFDLCVSQDKGDKKKCEELSRARRLLSHHFYAIWILAGQAKVLDRTAVAVLVNPVKATLFVRDVSPLNYANALKMSVDKTPGSWDSTTYNWVRELHETELNQFAVADFGKSDFAVGLKDEPLKKSYDAYAKAAKEEQEQAKQD